MNRILRLALLGTSLVALGWWVPSYASAQHVDILVFSSQPGGGQLQAAGYDFDQPARVFESFCAGGLCLYSAVDPGFRTPSASEAPSGAFAIQAGTEISLEIVALDAAVSVKVGSTTIDDPGESVVLGRATGLHTHPEFQVTAPKDAAGEFPLSFRLRATGGAGYADSPVYRLLLTTRDAVPTPTPTIAPPPPTPGPTSGTGRSGVRPVPGGGRTLISKDVGDQRWAITLDSDGTVTGNVFFLDGGPPAFVFCEEIESTGKDVRLACSGADRCLESPCLASAWSFIAEVELPRAFFQPPSP